MKWQEALPLGCADATAQHEAWDEIKRLQELCGYAHRLLCDPPKRMYEQYTRHELCTKLREVAEARGE